MERIYIIQEPDGLFVSEINPAESNMYLLYGVSIGASIEEYQNTGMAYYPYIGNEIPVDMENREKLIAVAIAYMGHVGYPCVGLDADFIDREWSLDIEAIFMKGHLDPITRGEFSRGQYDWDLTKEKTYEEIMKYLDSELDIPVTIYHYGKAGKGTFSIENCHLKDIMCYVPLAIFAGK